MNPEERYADYDAFAWFYNRHWGSQFAERAIPVMNRLLLPLIPPQAWILDLCCGTGQVAHALTTLGHRVTGIDGSAEMLRYARENASNAEFVLADARLFNIPPTFHAAISTFDSLNHIMSLVELAEVFRNVCLALLPGGLFVFDLNMEEKYQARWRESYAIVEEDNVCVVRRGYDADSKIGRNDITMFRLVERGWQRSDLALLQRCYAEDEVRSALENAGLGEIATFDAERDLKLTSTGRTFFRARKT